MSDELVIEQENKIIEIYYGNCNLLKKQMKVFDELRAKVERLGEFLQKRLKMINDWLRQSEDNAQKIKLCVKRYWNKLEHKRGFRRKMWEILTDLPAYQSVNAYCAYIEVRKAKQCEYVGTEPPADEIIDEYSIYMKKVALVFLKITSDSMEQAIGLFEAPECKVHGLLQIIEEAFNKINSFNGGPMYK